MDGGNYTNLWVVRESQIILGHKKDYSQVAGNICAEGAVKFNKVMCTGRKICAAGAKKN